MNLDYEKIPEHMREGLRLYIESGIEPGSFLTAILENNLVRAYQTADDINIARMKDWVTFLYWDLPSDCWGSPQVVQTWLETAGTKGVTE